MARSLEEILKHEDPDVVSAAQDRAYEILLDIHLGELREHLKLKQVEMAKRMGVSQPTIAGLEKPGRDLKLSSLKRYVEAAGGKVRLDIELPDGTHHGFNV